MVLRMRIIYLRDIYLRVYSKNCLRYIEFEILTALPVYRRALISYCSLLLLVSGLEYLSILKNYAIFSFQTRCLSELYGVITQTHFSPFLVVQIYSDIIQTSRFGQIIHKQEVMGRTNRLLSLIRHEAH
jgi:hypothetical protein